MSPVVRLVAVAVIAAPKGMLPDRVRPKLACPLASVVTVVEPTSVWPS